MPNSRRDARDAESVLSAGQFGSHMPMEKPSYIYALWDPDTFLMHYIGRSVDVKRRLQQHIDTARSDPCYHSSPSEWIRSLLAREERPAAHILETIYPCCALHARVQGAIRSWLHSLGRYGDDPNELERSFAAGFAYDMYVSAREMRHILHAAAQGQPLVNRVGSAEAVAAQEALAGLDTTDINFLAVDDAHAIWGIIRARIMETSPEWLQRQSSAETMGKNIEDLMRNARNARTRG